MKTGEHQYGGSTEVQTILSAIDPRIGWPILAFPFSFFEHKPGKGKRTRIFNVRLIPYRRPTQADIDTLINHHTFRGRTVLVTKHNT